MPLPPMSFPLLSMIPARPRPAAAAGEDPGGRNGSGGDGRGQPPDGDRRPPRPDGGPPDLDELWRDFNRKLNGFFGRRSGRGGGFRPPRRPGRLRPTPRMMGRVVFALLGMLVLGWLGSGFFVVPQGQVAVVSRLGSAATIDQPGLNWHDPAPFGSAVVVDTSALRTQPVGDSSVGTLSGAPRSSMLTADGDIVELRLSVQWRVGNAMDYVFGDRDPDAAVAQASEEAIRATIAGLSLQQVLHGNRAELARQAQARVQGLLDRWRSGVHVSDLSIQRLQVPEPVRTAYEDARKAHAEAQRMKAQAEEYARDLLPRAQATADALLQQAAGYKASVVAQAQGDAARFDLVEQQYRKAPRVTRESLYLQTMRYILGHVTKVLVDSRTSNNLLYLPLDQLLHGTARTAAPAPAVGAGAPTLPLAGALTLPGVSNDGASAPSPQASEPASAPTQASRSPRDTLRQRDSR